jgi:hypothetical protein
MLKSANTALQLNSVSSVAMLQFCNAEKTLIETAVVSVDIYGFFTV